MVIHHRWWRLHAALKCWSYLSDCRVLHPTRQPSSYSLLQKPRIILMRSVLMEFHFYKEAGRWTKNEWPVAVNWRYVLTVFLGFSLRVICNKTFLQGSCGSTACNSVMSQRVVKCFRSVACYNRLDSAEQASACTRVMSNVSTNWSLYFPSQ